MITIVVGDSYNSGYNATTKQDRDGWAQMLGIPEDHITAVGGTTALDWMGNKGDCFLRTVDLIQKADEGTQVVISLGGNDAFHIVRDGRVTAEELAASFQSLSWVFEKLAKLATRVCAFAYPNPYQSGNEKASLGLKVLNAAIAAIAARTSVAVIDLRAVLKDKAFFAPPDIHLTSEGHRELADHMKGILYDQSH